MRILTVVLLMALTAMTLNAAVVSGRVQFVGRAPGVAMTTVVYAEALDGRRVQPGQFKMTQQNKSFVPHVLAVPAGSTVAFPNVDAIFHNVFSLSRPGPFDLGLYRDGEGKSKTFTTPATYRVFCNIHPQMSSIILVVPTSFITETDTMGGYRLDLPAGRYRITAWSERAEPASVEMTVGGTAADAPALVLDESRFQPTLHKNKLGKDYPKEAYDTKKN